MEPIGGKRGDWQAATVCAAVCNVLLASRGVKKRFRVKDFLLEFGNVKEIGANRQSWQEQKLIAQMFDAAFSEPDKQKKR